MRAYSVPDLKFDAFIFNADHLGSEFDTNGDVMLMSVAVVSELKQQAWFSNPWKSVTLTCVAYNDVSE